VADGVGDGVVVGAADGVVGAGAGVVGTISTALAAPDGNSTVFDGSSYFVNVIDIVGLAHERMRYVALS
jgi:hypothetical protein